MSTGEAPARRARTEPRGTRRVAPPAGGRTTGPSRGRGRWSRARGDRPGRTPPCARDSQSGTPVGAPHRSAVRSRAPKGASSRRPRSGEDRRGPRRRRSSTRARPPGRGSGTPEGRRSECRSRPVRLGRGRGTPRPARSAVGAREGWGTTAPGSSSGERSRVATRRPSATRGRSGSRSSLRELGGATGTRA